MKQVGRNPDFVRIRLDIPKGTYRNLMELFKLSKAHGVTENPDVVAASCIDAIHRLMLEFESGGIDEKER